MFMDIVFYNRTAEVATKYLKKGSKILITGRIEFKQWKEGDNKRSKHILLVKSMEMMGKKNNSHSTTAGEVKY